VVVDRCCCAIVGAVLVRKVVDRAADAAVNAVRRRLNGWRKSMGG